MCEKHSRRFSLVLSASLLPYLWHAFPQIHLALVLSNTKWLCSTLLLFRYVRDRAQKTRLARRQVGTPSAMNQFSSGVAWLLDLAPFPSLTVAVVKAPLAQRNVHYTTLRQRVANAGAN